jgi:hypothetical protein
MNKPLVALCVVIIICSLLAGSLLLKPPASPDTSEGNQTQTTTTPTPQTTTQPTAQNISDPKLAQAIENAVTYLKGTQDATGLLMLNVLYRQFGITEFQDALQRYDQILTSNPEPINRIFRRIADANTQVQPSDFKSVTDALDRITVPALYSDQMPLPDDYLKQLTEARDSGFMYARKSTENSGCYLLTHVLLATIWLHDNNGSLQLSEEFMTTLYEENAALAGDGSKVNDIQLEAAAFLYEAGQGDRVASGFAEKVMEAQCIDGGWAISEDNPSGTNWHPSILALMILLHVAYPAESYPSMLA